jgi:prepilin-type N-terminal cleavage/methylation domain-containing protein
MKIRSHKTSAFSLIELLVVVAILGVLVSLLLPSLSKARQNAENLHCLANGRGAAVIMLNYMGDSKGFIPPLGPKGAPSWGYNYGTWYTYIRSYVTLNKPQAVAANQTYRNEDARPITCPSRVKGIYTYGYPYFSYAMPWNLRFRVSLNPETSWRIDELRDQSNTGLFVDSGYYADSIYYYSIGMFAQNESVISGALYYTAQHDGMGVGQVFMDGHAEFAGLTPEMRTTYTYPAQAKFAHRTFYGRTIYSAVNDGYLSVYYRYMP